MEFKDVIKNRYSCKKYSDKLVSADKIKSILEAGRMAPTAKNLQEHHIYVASSEKSMKLIDECTPCRYNAPAVMIVTFDKNNVYTYPDGDRESGVEDATIVATHLMLAATDAGVDSCWINCFHAQKLHNLLGLPENEEILMLLDLGYAAEDAGPLPNHFSRKPLEQTVSFI